MPGFDKFDPVKEGHSLTSLICLKFVRSLYMCYVGPCVCIVVRPSEPKLTFFSFPTALLMWKRVFTAYVTGSLLIAIYLDAHL